MTDLTQIAGTLLLVGGLGGVWNSVRARRKGEPWRGGGLTSATMTVYGGLTLARVVFNGTVRGAVIVWAVAAAVLAGMWIARRERRMASR